MTYTLTVNNVRDRATTPNPIAPNSQATFTATEFAPAAIGNPPLPGSVVMQTNGLDVVGSRLLAIAVSRPSAEGPFTNVFERGDLGAPVMAYARDFLGPYVGFQTNYVYWFGNWIGHGFGDRFRDRIRNDLGIRDRYRWNYDDIHRWWRRWWRRWRPGLVSGRDRGDARLVPACPLPAVLLRCRARRPARLELDS